MDPNAHTVSAFGNTKSSHDWIVGNIGPGLRRIGRSMAAMLAALAMATGRRRRNSRGNPIGIRQRGVRSG